MIDVHTLILPTEDPDLLAQSLASTEDHPITRHILQGVEGDVLAGRVSGYACGNNPYVSFVDPDDRVLPDAFQTCLDYLQQNENVGGVYTNSMVEYDNGLTAVHYRHTEWSYEFHLETGAPVHQLVVMRRDVLEQAIEATLTLDRIDEMKMFPDQLIFAQIAAIMPWHFLHADIGYVWKKRQTGTHKLPGYTKNKNLVQRTKTEILTQTIRSL